MNTSSLQKELDNLQKNTIGFFKHPLTNQLELVVEQDKDWIKTVSIKPLGGLHTNHISATEGRLVLFPNNKTLADMKDNPTELHEIQQAFYI